MSKEQRYEGGCLCGHIRFIAEGAPGFPHTCSCKMCQRHSGALTIAWVEFPRAAVRWTGGEPSVFRSSEVSSRAFCPKCGSTIGAIDDKPVIAIAIGVLDSNGRKGLAPQSHSYISKRPKWWRIS